MISSFYQIFQKIQKIPSIFGPWASLLYIDEGIKELVCERKGNMENNKKIFSPVTNWEIETYGKDQKKSKFSSRRFRCFCPVSSRSNVFICSGKEI